MSKKKIWTEEDLLKEEMYRENQFKDATWVSSWPEFEKRLLEHQEAARNTMRERGIKAAKPISIKVYPEELAMFKERAEKEWLRYQTKLNQLIYQYNRGQLQYVWDNSQ